MMKYRHSRALPISVIGGSKPLPTALVALLVSLALPAMAEPVSTAPASATPPTDIDWYLAHPGPRDRVIATCDEDTERLAKDPDCIDAREAEVRVPPTDFFDDMANFFGNLL